MTQTRFLQAIFAAAMLAATPAFAQTNMPTGDTGVGGKPNDPTGVAASPPQPHAAATNYSTLASAGHHHGAMHAHNNPSGDAAVDRLNQQSFEAVRNGQPFAPASSTTNQ